MFHLTPRFFGVMGAIVGLGLLSTAAVAQDTANGGTIFNGTCVACHADDGGGAFGGVPNLSDRLVKSDDELFTSVRGGFESPGSIMAMPSNGGNPNLSEQDVRDVIAYIRETFGSN